jgi:hypothetical protein
MPRDGTQSLAVPATWDAPSRHRCRPKQARRYIGARLPTFHAKAADQARVASMPDTTWPVSGLPPDSSQSPNDAPVSMSPDCITTRPQRFACARLPDPHLTPYMTPFPHRSPRTAFSRRSMWRFEASLRRATPKGQTFIFRTAPRSTMTTYRSPPPAFVAHHRMQLRAFAGAWPHRGEDHAGGSGAGRPDRLAARTW